MTSPTEGNGPKLTLPEVAATEPYPSTHQEDPGTLYKAYAEYSRTLRTWLIAYGVGGPVLLFSRDNAWTALSSARLTKPLITLFTVGVVAQVILAALNKSAMWSLYYGALRPSFKASRPYRLAAWFAEYIVIDVVIDFASIILFAWATWFAFRVLVVS